MFIFVCFCLVSGPVYVCVYAFGCEYISCVSDRLSVWVSFPAGVCLCVGIEAFFGARRVDVVQLLLLL